MVYSLPGTIHQAERTLYHKQYVQLVKEKRVTDMWCNPQAPTILFTRKTN
jgi:hypothetical protein